MCLLPPPCLFCRHYRPDAAVDEPDCDAFEEIPEAIFRGHSDHHDPYPGDGGVRFLLDEALAEEFREVNGLREEMNLRPYRP